MLKKIISKKGIVITLIVISCLIVFTILMILSDKISYNVEEVNGNYNVSVNNRWGKRIYENVYGVAPIIMQVGKDTILIRTGKGDSWITKFINGKTNRVSDDFENISAYNGQLVVYGIYEDEQLKIVIRDIYDKDKVYKEVIDIVKGKDINTILDLYCGTGTISLLVSRYVRKVYGVEIVKEGIIDANYNKKINNIDNIEFFCMDAKDFLEKYNKEIDMIIVDPPRSGLSNSARRLLLDKKCNNIIYISCDLMSFARDIKELNREYEIESIKLVDEFPNTYHVETIAFLTHQ